MDPVPKPKKHLFCATFKFGDRYIDANLYDDNSTNWYDNLAEQEILKVDPNFDQRTEWGRDPKDITLLQLLVREYTIEAPLPKYDFNFIVKKLLPGYQRRNVYRGTEDVCIRAILFRFFWKEINAQLSPPVPEGTADTGW